MKQCKKKQPNETEIALRREETAHKQEYLSYKRPENERKCVFPLVSQPSLPDARAFLIYDRGAEAAGGDAGCCAVEGCMAKRN